jgi:hypothetical protein
MRYFAVIRMKTRRRGARFVVLRTRIYDDVLLVVAMAQRGSRRGGAARTYFADMVVNNLYSEMAMFFADGKSVDEKEYRRHLRRMSTVDLMPTSDDEIVRFAWQSSFEDFEAARRRKKK